MFSKYFGKFFGVLQKVGQSLMIPITVLPAAGLLVAFGRLLKSSTPEAQTTFVNLVGQVMYSGGLAIFEQLPLVFAIGVAIGFSGQAGIAGLSAAVAYFTLTNILKVFGDTMHMSMAINTGVFGGILVGLLSATLYNRYHKIQLHPVLGFFSGRRFIPIITTFATFGLAIILAYVWPPVQTGIHDFGLSVLNSPFGPAFYAAGKRLLIPVGLHHVYYPSFLYDFGEFVTATGQTVRGDATRYFAGDKTAGIFMASEFPIMLFGLPAACLAMVLAAAPEKRKAVGGIMLSAALTSIITGITEPIEFAFIFVAPLLFVVHVAFAFVSGLLTHWFDLHLGYTFSASLIDLILGYFNQKNISSLLIIGPVMALLYFSAFYTLIRIFNFKTPGREVENETTLTTGATPAKDVPATQRSQEILIALGGSTNINTLDACITRLRLNVRDAALVNKDRLKALGAAGIMQNGQNVQVVYGVESDRIKEEIRTLMNLGAGPSPSQNTFASPIQGEIIPLEQVPDAAFAQKVLGDGFAIKPSEGLVFAPFDGKVVTLFPTNHAIGIETQNGLEVLIHVGIDTVKMKGEGFKAFVKEGDIVRAGEKFLEFDLNLVRQKATSDISPVVITNMPKVKSFAVQPQRNVSSMGSAAQFELN